MWVVGLESDLLLCINLTHINTDAAGIFQSL